MLSIDITFVKNGLGMRKVIRVSGTFECPEKAQNGFR